LFIPYIAIFVLIFAFLFHLAFR